MQALHKNGYAIVDDDPDYVVVGEGRTFNMEIVEAAVRMILRGSKLIATNIDPNCPTAHGLRPGCGAIVAMLETATGVKAFGVGKPSAIMIRLNVWPGGEPPGAVVVAGGGGVPELDIASRIAKSAANSPEMK